MITNAKTGSSSFLQGKTIVITGATSGIGLQAAIDFARLGARIIGVGRDPKRCSAAKQQVLCKTPKAQIEYLLANLSSQAQVRTLASDIKKVLKRWGQNHLDILVNDAGTYSGRRILTEDGTELTMAVNHYAPFLLTHELLPLLTAARESKVLTVSSGSHYNTDIHINRIDHPLIYFGLWAYKVSKLANVLFTLEFNRRFSRSTVRAYAVDPGLVNTEIAFKGTDPISKFVWKIRKNSGTLPEVPVRTMLYLAQKPSAQRNGEYYWKDSLPKTPSRVAQHPELARRLWEKSCNLCATPDWLKEQ
jgi:NAD(P)-dependent dehydrogenase (short-subunit alcohol dehydrogenase family)